MSIVNIVEFIILMTIVGSCAAISSRFIRLPLPLLLIVFGFLTFEVLTGSGYDTGIRASSFPDLIFFVLLPVLIFEAAYNINQAQLKKNLLPILLLAILGLIISTLLTAVGLFYGMGQGFPWISALIAGALLAATDPVSVVTQLKDLKAPGNLAVLIEGESLFNDATAIVLFSVLLGLATSSQNDLSLIGSVGSFFLTFFGGALVGILAGVIAMAAGRLLRGFSALATVSIVAAYGSFYIAEHMFHVSGVMAVLLAGLIIGREHQKSVSSVAREALENIWELLAYFFNMLIFVLVGVVITLGMFTERWLAMVIAILAVLVARTIAVYFSIWLSNTLPSTTVDRRYQPVMVWGGLRGAVTIALVFTLPTELEYWWTIQSIAFGVVLFTLAVQAPTNVWLLKKLKII